VAGGRRARPGAIALFGLFGSGNTGNDASLEAMLALIRRARPEAPLLCICGEPFRIGRAFDISAAPIHQDRPGNRLARKLADLGHAFRRLKGADLMIVPGTGALDDFGTGPSGLPLALFTWCLAARLRGAAIAFVSVGAGPIRHPLSRWLMKAAIGMAHYRSYRDKSSKAFASGIGIAAGAEEIYPDLAFSLPVPEAAARPRPEGGPLTVGVGVMTYQGWRNDPVSGAAIYAAYIGRMTAFVLWLLGRGHGVRLLMGDGTDRRAAEDLRRNVLERFGAPGPAAIEVKSCVTLHDLMDEIAGTDVVVATRFHTLVAAVMTGRPVLSIGYAQKNDDLMADVGLGRFCQSIESLDAGRLIGQFTEMAAGMEGWRRRLEAARRKYQTRLAFQEAVLAGGVLAPPDGRMAPTLALPASHREG
jgi:polysaccharide pyruvyl transferase WcaK-like protein